MPRRGSSNRKLKLKLWNEDNRCYWCKKPTSLNEGGKDSSVKISPLTATIDHLVSRLSPMRWEPVKKGQKTKVLSCYQCNVNRSKKEHLFLSRDELFKRSHGYSFKKLK